MHHAHAVHPEPADIVPASRRRRRWFVRVCLLLAFAAGGRLAWREYDFRNAIREANAEMLNWQYSDPYEAIKRDWKAAFRKTTWAEGPRDLVLRDADHLVRHHNLVRRLAPRFLSIEDMGGLKDLALLDCLPALTKLWLKGCRDVANLDALRELTNLQWLSLSGCPDHTNMDALGSLRNLRTLGLSRCEMQNLDAIKGLPALEEVSIFAGIALRNLDGLKQLPALKVLRLYECDALTNLDALAGLPALEDLALVCLPGLTSVDSLKGLSTLRRLWFNSCPGLTNLDAIHGLSGLKEIHISNCAGLPQEAVEALRKALPKTRVSTH